HRDTKPANIMVDVAGTLKILDFGIARLAQSSGITRVGAQIGTLNYMSPEQLVGQPVDHRSDIFSVGAVCYELFAYRQAFPGGIHTGLLHRLLNGQTEPLGSLCPALDPEIVRIVHRCLEANVERRYPDLAAVQKDLAKVRARLASEETLAPAADLAGPGSETASGSSSGSTARRLVDRTELARRRANQIERHLRAASDAFASGNFDGTVAECERVLMLDAEQPQALELLDRARAAIDERHADALAQEAEAELQRGALAVAGAKLDEAQALSPASRRAADGRAALDRALAERDEVRRRRRALADCVADARRCFARGAFEEAIAALDQAL